MRFGDLIYLCRRDPEEARGLVRRALRRSGGNLRAAARELGVAGDRLLVALRRLGMTDEPRRQRREAERRFRLL